MLAEELERTYAGTKGVEAATEAVELLKPFNDRLPRKGLIVLARAYGKKNDPISQLRTLELSLAKNPNDYVIQTMLGEAHSRAKRAEESVAAFMEAKKINAKYKPAYEGLLKEYERTQDRYEARTTLNDMIKVFGHDPRFYASLCRLYALDNFLEKSVEICRKAIEQDPSNPESYVHLGNSLRDQEEADKAQRVLSDAVKRFPASEPVQTAAGELHLAKKDFVGAYKLFRQAAQSDPKSSRAVTGLAQTSFELQKYEEALGAFVQACKIERKSLGEFRLAMGKLRSRKDFDWLSKYEAGMARCL